MSAVTENREWAEVTYRKLKVFRQRLDRGEKGYPCKNFGKNIPEGSINTGAEVGEIGDMKHVNHGKGLGFHSNNSKKAF